MNYLKNLKIYFDTEFTGLEEHPPLISIGFVTQLGKTFYAELTDTYDITQCGEFCQKEVLIHLEKTSHVEMTLEQLRYSLNNWFEDKPFSILLCDSKRDLEQLDRIFPKGLPFNIEAKTINWLEQIKRKIGNKNNKVHRALNLRTHHALDDARVNMMILQNLIMI